VTGFRKLEDGVKYAKALADRPDEVSPYLKVEVDQYSVFLGNAIYKGADDQIHVCARVVSYPINTLVPERGIYSFFRKYPATGHLARREIYSTAPEWPIVDEIVERLFKDTFGYHLTTKYSALAAAEAASLSGLTEVDKLVLMDPSRLSYRFNASEVSGGLRDELTLTIPPDHLEILSSHVYTRVGGSRRMEV
jgi:hypothetical protein